MRNLLNRAGIFVLFTFMCFFGFAQKRLYISNDDHTDYMWSANEAGYKSAIVDSMLDWWIAHNTATLVNAPDYQSKWNCDGSLWVSLYERNRTQEQVDSLFAQIKRGQIMVPYSPFVCTYGAMPAEAVLRGMYYAGSLERQHGLDFSMVTAMENQTLPLGLSSLWKGAGAKYAWHGVCNCDTKMTGFDNRQNEIYWYKGLDTNRILLKWYKMEDLSQNYFIGGYAESMLENNAIDAISAKANSTAYPFNIAAAFGVGHDNLYTNTDNLIAAAQANSDASQRVIVSNEEDFFRDFEATYGNDPLLTEQTKTFGNEWDLNCASIAEVSGKVKRSMEKLRAAEAMAAIVINYDHTFMGPLLAMRKQAWESIGLYWEHSLGFGNGGVALEERNAFQRRLETDISGYVDALYNLAKKNLALLVTNGLGVNTRFFAFNPLGWERTDYADFRYDVNNNIHVLDVTSNTEVPFQFVTKNGLSYLRVLATNIPSVGYRVYEIQSGAGSSYPVAGTNTGNVLENDYFKITYTNSGVLTSVLDKQNSNKELVEAGKYLNDFGSGNSSTGTAVVENSGPVSITVLTSSSDPKQHTTRITLYKNVNRVDIDNQVTENFSDSVRTWNYSFNINTPEIWHEETGAVIKAKLTTNGGHYSPQNARYDWNTLNHFVSVNEPSGYGVSLSNQDCFFMQIGNSTVTSLDENSAAIKVLSGGTIGGLGILNQGGDMEFNQRFAITTHTAYSAATEMKKALEHQNFLVCDTITSPVNFLLPDHFSYVSTSDPGSLIWCVKPAEEEATGGTITRIWNLANTDAPQTLTYGIVLNSAYRTTHVETNIESITVPANTYDLPIALGHNEMKSFRVLPYIVPLPVQLFSFVGYRPANTSSNELNWNTGDEAGLREYIIERSVDGNNFAPISSVAKNNGVYSYSDKNVNTALSFYYRLKLVNSNGTFTYSNIVFIRPDKSAADLIVYPNPVSTEVHANLILSSKTRCQVMIVNAAGVIVKTTAPPLFERGFNNYSVSVTELPAGAYNLVIIAAGKKYMQPFIKK